MRVGSDVFMLAMEIGWHDRRGQHLCVLNRTCLYAPIQNYESLRTKLRWHDRQGQHGSVLDLTCLYAPWRLSGMTDEINMIVFWIGCVYMLQSENMNCPKRKFGWHDRRSHHGGVLDRMCQYAPIQKYILFRNRLAMCELLS